MSARAQHLLPSNRVEVQHSHGVQVLHLTFHKEVTQVTIRCRRGGGRGRPRGCAGDRVGCAYTWRTEGEVELL